MSNEKKIKDLMARLAAMSPEPPPYPENTPLVRPETRRSPRPALAFAAAVGLVALLAVPLLLFTGGDEPVVLGSTTTTSTTTPETTTTVPSTSTTEPATTTTTTPTAVEVSGVVFLYQEPENSFLGNPALAPIAATVRVTGAAEEEVDFATAWQMVGEGREGLPEGLRTAIPPAVVVESTAIEGDLIIAEMTGAFPEGATPAGLLADMTMLNQLIYTITQADPGARVLFTVDGQPVNAFGTDGLDLTEPVDRATFRDDHLHSINLTAPVVPQGDGSYLVEGIANVFEAMVNIAVIDGDGAVVHEEFVSASCGTGCWGDFSTSIDAGLIVPGESSIRVFTYSAEDDSVSEAITVPIPPGDVWLFTVGE